MDRGESIGVCDFSHFDALPRDAAVSANGTGGAVAASRLGEIRYSACGLSTEADVGRGASTRLRLALSTVVLLEIDLGATSGTGGGDATVFGDVASLQTLEPSLAFLNQTSTGACGLVAPGEHNAAEARAISNEARAERGAGWAIRNAGGFGSLSLCDLSRGVGFKAFITRIIWRSGCGLSGKRGLQRPLKALKKDGRWYFADHSEFFAWGFRR